VLRTTQARRLKILAALAALCAGASVVATAILWRSWRIDRIAAGLGLHADPVTVGVAFSLVPTYFVALEIWLPSMPRRTAAPVRPLSDDDVHWRAVRVVALLCILLTEVMVDAVPGHHPATASARIAAYRGEGQ
jgi:hypothetical protein